MIHAYDSMYLEDAMQNLGDAFDYAANECCIDKDEFMGMFITSGMAKPFERGDSRIVAGLSGIELVCSILHRIGLGDNYPQYIPRTDASSDFWCGWILAYYQWKSGKSFKGISRIISMKELEALYPVLHEASEEKFADVMLNREKEMELPVNLQRLRRNAGLTQKELAERSGVSLRAIQQYEERSKDINKAQAASIYSLSRVLGCNMDDLLEI